MDYVKGCAIVDRLWDENFHWVEFAFHDHDWCLHDDAWLLDLWWWYLIVDLWCLYSVMIEDDKV